MVNKKHNHRIQHQTTKLNYNNTNKLQTATYLWSNIYTLQYLNFWIKWYLETLFEHLFLVTSRTLQIQPIIKMHTTTT